MIGVVIPAHNEEDLIEACLQAALVASAHPDLAGEDVQIVVVLDACTDGTAERTACYGVNVVDIAAQSVGMARAAGADFMLHRGARWLAFTDADTRVSPGWLVQQLVQGTDAVCGTVAIDDWTDHGADAAALLQHFLRTYSDVDGHPHIHGANLGVSAAAYRKAGGFAALASSEDLAFVKALQASGARIAWSAAPRVTTSARRHARAPLGFASALCGAVSAMRPENQAGQQAVL